MDVKHYLTAIAIAFLLAFCAGCQNTLPKPTNANGSLNYSVAEAEAEITYRNATTDAAAYISGCRIGTVTLGCSEDTYAKIKAADADAYAKLLLARTAVSQVNPDAHGIDRAINALQVALTLLQNLIPKH
jgi:hypothetical protein